MKYLIVNADDFGYSRVFNETILELIDQGFVTGTSVMVNWVIEKQQDQVKRLIELHRIRNVTIGLHVEGRESDFRQTIDEQWLKFTTLFGFPPEHIDIHKKDSLENVYPILVAAAEEHGVPCKNLGVGPKSHWMTNEEEFRGTKHTIEETEAWLATLKDDEYYHVTYHPGTFDPDSKSSLNKEREIDAQKVIQLSRLLPKYGVELASSRDFAAYVRAGKK